VSTVPLPKKELDSPQVDMGRHTNKCDGSCEAKSRITAKFKHTIIMNDKAPSILVFVEVGKNHIMFNISKCKDGFEIDVATVDAYDVEDIDLLLKTPLIISSRKELVNLLRQLRLSTIAELVDEIVDEIWENYIQRWNTLIRQERFKKAFLSVLSPKISLNLLNTSRSGDNQPWDFTGNFHKTLLALKNMGTITSINRKFIDKLLNKKEITGEDLFRLYSEVFGEEVGDAVEVVFANALTLRIVDRQRGWVRQRPNWLLVCSDPSALKSSIVLGSLGKSRYVYKLGDITPASILPTNPKVPSVAEKIHNKIALFLTLSEIAEKDAKVAGEIIAKFEEIYDGEVRREFAINEGSRAAFVDTVILGAITTATYEQKLRKKMVAYGSRWLIYRYELSDNDVFRVARLQRFLQFNDIVEMMTRLSSTLLDYGLRSIGAEVFYNYVIIGREFRKDLETLAKLLANLRCVCIRTREKVKTREEEHIVDEIEVIQKDTPIRSYHQLVNLVTADVIARQLPKLDATLMVDKHAMRLAAKTALGGSSVKYEKILRKLLEIGLRTNNISPSLRDLAEQLGIKKTTLHRQLRVLECVGIITSTNSPRIAEPYASVLGKYLL